jgi:hypothetical protein
VLPPFTAWFATSRPDRPAVREADWLLRCAVSVLSVLNTMTARIAVAARIAAAWVTAKAYGRDRRFRAVVWTAGLN